MEAVGASSFGSKLGYLVHHRSFQVALVLWLVISVAAVALCDGTMPLPIGLHPDKPIAMVVSSSIALLFLVLEIGLVGLITRRRALPDLARRAPERSVALRETIALWLYGALVLLVGRFVGLHYFGESIAMHAKLASPVTAFLLGAASYPAIHVFESWTRYDSLLHSTLSVIVVFLIFFPPGMMKSFLTLRTGNAWVHVWGFHAISPHVTIDTRLIVRDFNIR